MYHRLLRREFSLQVCLTRTYVFPIPCCILIDFYQGLGRGEDVCIVWLLGSVMGQYGSGITSVCMSVFISWVSVSCRVLGFCSDYVALSYWLSNNCGCFSGSGLSFLYV
jgi:hypothetical protein